ncbi:hypothetical protein AAZX31_04G051600 [Glycine max]|nr:hypothetical protein JHK87_008992 [Glycine soja]KAG5048277.1 hypothetical protein JHK85_009380 [Glycine max]KAG5065395.1 hypothetical protein JHK86_009126 [Glycine max]KAH1252626.1 hypothetical protein GmHk_04G009551 [Glycine max]RZC15131.1 hypothetical protein D0Y65_008836 [Glycine soja]
MNVMGRKVPIENLSLIHPVIYLSFLAAGLAASMAIITALCSDRFRRKKSPSPPPPSSDPIEIAQELDATIPSNNETENENNNNNNEEEEQVKELPLPPALQQHPKDPFISDRMKRVTSERKAPLSLSIKMPRSLSVAKNWEQKEDKNKGTNIGGKLKAEDSVWMKTIILGEKCVPDEEDDPVIFEGRGKRISAYHSKRHSTMSISRQTSFLEPDALPKPLSVPQSRTHDETTSSA